ncbi:MAG: restriction endonuclease [Roseivirga sp.]|nr:restriction endonuclease [Roseivirga sp.]
MATPLDSITDGHEFQRIVAEYFRCLREEQHDYHIADVQVQANGVGADDGCDILVEFYFEDAITRHSWRWVIECKCWNRAIGPNDINIGRISSIMKANNANGYLLVCKNDATASLIRDFQRFHQNGTEEKYMIWNGTQVWRKFAERVGILKAYFPDYYKEKLVDTNDEINYEELFEEFKKKLEK